MLPPPPPHTGGGILWSLVHAQCTPHERQAGIPAPCLVVDLSGGEARGYALLKDRNGVAQLLLLPTARITGIEDPQLLAPGGPDYFALAWAARSRVAARLPRPAPDTALLVAVNSIYGRSQDQLHLHIDCLSPAAAAVLAGARLDPRWRPLSIGPRRYLARHVASLDGDDDPFRLLARTRRDARADMGAWTLAATAAPAGGFTVLADRANPAQGDFASAEELQDHACALGGPPLSRATSPLADDRRSRLS
jgi:CDP-diacylglycerol pyrophosphatase